MSIKLLEAIEVPSIYTDGNNFKVSLSWDVVGHVPQALLWSLALDHITSAMSGCLIHVDPDSIDVEVVLGEEMIPHV